MENVLERYTVLVEEGETLELSELIISFPELRNLLGVSEQVALNPKTEPNSSDHVYTVPQLKPQTERIKAQEQDRSASDLITERII